MVCLTVAETFDVVLGEAAVGVILEGRAAAVSGVDRRAQIVADHRHVKFPIRARLVAKLF
jgi:uncharacterized NAD-dependent epimerase/dehydratase family protein